MNTEIPPRLTIALNDGETILWHDKPKTPPFIGPLVFGGCSAAVFAILLIIALPTVEAIKLVIFMFIAVLACALLFALYIKNHRTQSFSINNQRAIVFWDRPKPRLACVPLTANTFVGMDTHGNLQICEAGGIVAGPKPGLQFRGVSNYRHRRIFQDFGQGGCIAFRGLADTAAPVELLTRRMAEA